MLRIRMRHRRESRLKAWYAFHDRFEKFKKGLKSRLPAHSHVKSSRAYKIFGTTLLRRELWSFKAEPLARGLALGLFVAFTPTMGFQMLVVAFLIMFFPGNLPIALAACWLTNPLTAAPVYYFEYKLGQRVMAFLTNSPLGALEGRPAFSDMSSIFDIAGAMWVGSVIVGIFSAAAGYAMIHGIVYLERKVRFEKLLHLRRTRDEVKRNNGSG